MEKYTIYCTEEQTKKALELGAPIRTSYNRFDNAVSPICCENNRWLYAVIPTAEQMIGWLEEQGFYITISSSGGSVEIDFDCICEEVGTSRKNATLAAIDAALNYLMEE